jgi:hypothetical protein
MTLMSVASIPGDIERRDLTDEQVDLLLMGFGGEARDKGLVATFIKRAQENGLTTLVTHFKRATAAIPAAVPVAEADAAAAATCSPSVLGSRSLGRRS